MERDANWFVTVGPLPIPVGTMEVWLSYPSIDRPSRASSGGEGVMSSSPDVTVVMLSCSGCGRESSSTFKALVTDPLVLCPICAAPQYVAQHQLERQDAQAQVLLRALDKTMRHAENPPK